MEEKYKVLFVSVVCSGVVFIVGVVVGLSFCG